MGKECGARFSRRLWGGSNKSPLKTTAWEANLEQENAKTLLKKQNKTIRFADNSPAGWSAVEEYETDELADDSEDEKKLRSAERRALTKLRLWKQNCNSL